MLYTPNLYLNASLGTKSPRLARISSRKLQSTQKLIEYRNERISRLQTFRKAKFIDLAKKQNTMQNGDERILRQNFSCLSLLK